MRSGNLSIGFRGAYWEHHTAELNHSVQTLPCASSRVGNWSFGGGSIGYWPLSLQESPNTISRLGDLSQWAWGLVLFEALGTHRSSPVFTEKPGRNKVR